MDNESRPVERRRHKRFRVEDEAFFVLSPNCTSLGEIVDISKGGFAFYYVGDNEWSDELFELGVLFGDEDFYVDSLPLKTISDVVVENGRTAGPRRVRQRAVQFGELSPDQLSVLDHLLKSKVRGEA